MNWFRKHQFIRFNFLCFVQNYLNSIQCCNTGQSIGNSTNWIPSNVQHIKGQQRNAPQIWLNSSLTSNSCCEEQLEKIYTNLRIFSHDFRVFSEETVVKTKQHQTHTTSQTSTSPKYCDRYKIWDQWWNRQWWYQQLNNEEKHITSKCSNIMCQETIIRSKKNDLKNGADLNLQRNENKHGLSLHSIPNGSNQSKNYSSWYNLKLIVIIFYLRNSKWDSFTQVQVPKHCLRQINSIKNFWCFLFRFHFFWSVHFSSTHARRFVMAVKLIYQFFDYLQLISASKQWYYILKVTIILLLIIKFK